MPRCSIHTSENSHVSFLFYFLWCAGNYEHNGRTRQIELWNACRALNIPAENITLVNATLLQDDPAATWKSPIIAKQILKQVHSLDIDVIITFDREGVSHHPNHCAIFYSSVSVYVASLLPDGWYFICGNCTRPHHTPTICFILFSCIQDAAYSHLTLSMYAENIHLYSIYCWAWQYPATGVFSVGAIFVCCRKRWPNIVHRWCGSDGCTSFSHVTWLSIRCAKWMCPMRNWKYK